MNLPDVVAKIVVDCPKEGPAAQAFLSDLLAPLFALRDGEDEFLAMIERRYQSPITTAQVAYDVGGLIGMVRRLKHERKDLLERLRDALVPD